MNEKFKFSDALISSSKTHAWVPSDEAWAEIHRLQNELSGIEEQKAVALEDNQNLYNKTLALQNQIDALKRDYMTACHQRDIETRKAAELRGKLNDSDAFKQESHDKLIELQTQVLTFLSVTLMITKGQATFEQGGKVLAELQRLALE